MTSHLLRGVQAAPVAFFSQRDICVNHMKYIKGLGALKLYIKMVKNIYCFCAMHINCNGLQIAHDDF